MYIVNFINVKLSYIFNEEVVFLVDVFEKLKYGWLNLSIVKLDYINVIIMFIVNIYFYC